MPGPDQGQLKQKLIPPHFSYEHSQREGLREACLNKMISLFQCPLSWEGRKVSNLAGLSS